MQISSSCKNLQYFHLAISNTSNLSTLPRSNINVGTEKKSGAWNRVNTVYCSESAGLAEAAPGVPKTGRLSSLPAATVARKIAPAYGTRGTVRYVELTSGAKVCPRVLDRALSALALAAFLHGQLN